MPFMAMILTPHDTWKYLSTIVKINVYGIDFPHQYNLTDMAKLYLAYLLT